MAVKNCTVIGGECGGPILALTTKVEGKQVLAVRSVTRNALCTSAAVGVAEKYLVTHGNICDRCADFQYDASAWEWLERRLHGAIAARGDYSYLRGPKRRVAGLVSRRWRKKDLYDRCPSRGFPPAPRQTVQVRS